MKRLVFIALGLFFHAACATSPALARESDGLARAERDYRALAARVARLEETLFADAEIARYRTEYFSSLKSCTDGSSGRQPGADPDSADILYSGDVHADPEAATNHLALLRRLHEDTVARPLVLGVEMPRVAQSSLERYLRREISDDRFGATVWRQYGFGVLGELDTWPQFQPLFAFARDNAIPIMALDISQTPDSTLQQRDAAIARGIHGILAERPGAQLFVVYGDYHLAGHLLTEVANVRPAVRQVAVHQVIGPDLHFALARTAGSEEALARRLIPLCPGHLYLQPHLRLQEQLERILALYQAYAGE